MSSRLDSIFKSIRTSPYRGIAHFIAGPISVIALVARGILDTCNVFRSHPSHLNPRNRNLIRSYFVMKKAGVSQEKLESFKKVLIEKIGLVLISLMGTVAWAAVAYGVLQLAAASWAVFKTILVFVAVTGLAGTGIIPAIGLGALVLGLIGVVIHHCLSQKSKTNDRTDTYTILSKNTVAGAPEDLVGSNSKHLMARSSENQNSVREGSLSASIKPIEQHEIINNDNDWDKQ